MDIKLLNLNDLKPTLKIPEKEELHVYIITSGVSGNLHKNIREYSHIQLRRILSAYTGIPCERLSFTAGKHGKPALSHTGKAPLLHFNLSHSGEYAVLVFSSCTPIGIDIEYTNRKANIDKIAERIFLPEEIKKLKYISDEEEKRQYFFFLWTRTESFLKGLGCGLSAPFSDKKIQEEYSLWEIRPLPAPEDYVITLAYRKL